MTKCPLCRVNAWKPGQYGFLKCPNCATPFLVGKTEIKVDTRNNIKFLQPAARKRAKDSEPVKNPATGEIQVLCAGCQLPIPVAETLPLGSAIDGRVETNGKTLSRIETPVGWTLLPDNQTFVPHYERRFIPKQLRGWFCFECSCYLPVVDMSTVWQTNSRDRANRGDSDIRTNGLPKHLGAFTTISPLGVVTTVSEAEYFSRFMAGEPGYLDPNPQWAHTGNNDWLSQKTIGGPTYDYPDSYVYRRSFHHVPMGSVGWLSGSRFGRRIRPLGVSTRFALPWSQRERPTSPRRIVGPLQTIPSPLPTDRCKHGLKTGQCAWC